MPLWSELSGTWSDISGVWDSVSTFTSRLIFQPPVVDQMPRTNIDMNSHDRRFWNYWRRGPVGVNVYKLTDGTYTQVQPPRPEDVAVWYLGGHIYDVSLEEAANLVAAGYTVIETSPPEVGGEIDEWSDLAGRQWLEFAGEQWADL